MAKDATAIGDAKGAKVQLAFRFTSQRQESIYKRLGRLVGAGPAAFFKDACRLMQEDFPLQTASHMAGHAMREVESALRKVMLPLDFKRKQGDRGDDHRQEVAAVLAEYDIRQPARDFWLRLCDRDDEFNLPRWAHRDALEAPRQPDKNLEELWSKFQVSVDMLLEGLETNYLKTRGPIDKLLAEAQPSEADIKTLRNCVPNNLVCRYDFFSKLQNPLWLRLLSENGFFVAPEPVRSEDGAGIHYPPWPQSVYLIQMARRGGEIAEEVLGMSWPSI